MQNHHYTFTYSPEAIAYSNAKKAWRKRYAEHSANSRAAKIERANLAREGLVWRAAYAHGTVMSLKWTATAMMEERTKLTDDWKALLASGHVARWRSDDVHLTAAE